MTDPVRNSPDSALAALEEIYRIAHIPTPAGTKAYTHFQRDFDQIRAICKEHISNAPRGVSQ